MERFARGGSAVPEIVMVPVPVERLNEVYTLLANKRDVYTVLAAEREEERGQENHNGSRVVKGLPAVGFKQYPDGDLVRCAYVESSPAMRTDFSISTLSSCFAPTIPPRTLMP